MNKRENQQIDIPARKPPIVTTIQMPETVVKGSNSEVLNRNAILAIALTWFVHVAGMTTLSWYIFSIIAGSGTHWAVLAGTGIVLINRYSANYSKLMEILSGDWAAVEEIRHRYELGNKIADYQYKLSGKQLDMDWEGMTNEAKLQIQREINEGRFAEALEQNRIYRVEADHKEGDAKEVLRRQEDQQFQTLMENWVIKVYQTGDPNSVQPWGSKSDWPKVMKDRAHTMLTQMQTDRYPLFVIHRDTGNRPKFDFETYKTVDQAMKYLRRYL